MAKEPLSAHARDDLVRRAIDANARRFPRGGAAKPTAHEFYRASDDFYLVVADYFDGLPRLPTSACPYCRAPLVRAFDPWGLDGLWWAESLIYRFEEPVPCEHFRSLLGGLRLAEADVPAQMLMNARPGPEAPFVVPRLLGLPSMIAVVGELTMDRGGPAYTIAYYSDVAIEPVDLHQDWCRAVHWFENNGEDAWTLANDEWDFELDPYLETGQLRWVRLDTGESPPLVRRATDTEACPYVGLPGERRPQLVSPGSRVWLDPPDGSPIDPFD